MEADAGVPWAKTTGPADRVAPLPIREGAAVPWQPVTCELHAASIASPEPRPAASQSIACDCADGLTMFAAERGLGLWVDVEELSALSPFTAPFVAATRCAPGAGRCSPPVPR